MADIQLYINDQLADLDPNQVIAITRQINNFGDLATRQSTFTNSFTLPFTYNNQKILGNAGVVMNGIDAPYHKLDIRLRVKGTCIISKGIGILRKSSIKGRNYNISVYDGNKHFFQTIENKDISQLDWSSLQHDLTNDNFIDSFNNDYTDGYIYGIGDFGNTNVGTSSSDKIEINYQLPSIFVRHIWDKLFSESGFTPNFVPEDDLLITPKRGWKSELDSLASSWSYDSPTNGTVIPDTALASGKYVAQIIINDSQTNLEDNIYSIQDTQNYHIKFDFDNTMVLSNLYSVIIYRTDVNGNVTIIDEVLATHVSGSGELGDNSQWTCSYDNTLTLTEGDKIDFWAKYSRTAGGSCEGEYQDGCECASCDPYEGCDDWVCFDTGFDENITFETVSSSVAVVNITNLIGEMSQKDFIKFVLQKYALMMRTDVRNKTVEFIKAKDMLQMSNAVDWSDKYIEVQDEDYILANYGQKNNFGYFYKKNDDYPFADAQMLIENNTLPDYKEVIKLPFVASEKSDKKLNDDFLQFAPFWEAQRDDNGSVTSWKSLQGKNYLMRVQTKNGQLRYGTTDGVAEVYNGDYPILSFDGLQWQNGITDNYQEINEMLNWNKKVNIKLKINSSQFNAIDMFKLVYFKQLGAYFYINKIKLSSNKQTTVGEFVYVKL